VDRGNECIGRHRDDGEGALPRARLGIAPIFPYAGDAERLAVLPGDRLPLAAVAFLKKAVHRHDAAAPAIGVAEPLIFGDRFGARMDRREIWTPLSDVGNEAPTQVAFHRPPGFGIPPVDELRFVWPSLLIHGCWPQRNRNSKPNDSVSFLVRQGHYIWDLRYSARR
jgi:hypothetical protein